jgi:hypothetical protein
MIIRYQLLLSNELYVLCIIGLQLACALLRPASWVCRNYLGKDGNCNKKATQQHFSQGSVFARKIKLRALPYLDTGTVNGTVTSFNDPP